MTPTQVLLRPVGPELVVVTEKVMFGCGDFFKVQPHTTTHYDVFCSLLSRTIPLQFPSCLWRIYVEPSPSSNVKLAPYTRSSSSTTKNENIYRNPPQI